ncbi:Sec-independent protein translocase subunit TatA [Streptomyces sp. FH025]|uniref:Sec-independent protein translocase subunit TatA n=1 Tax=Streptomyces sp. FH025 TaxID=2815937 RepID=UPI001A9D9253|nr:Sec-independent protein translocase subunit TatA [Streptomyces sp. FH025]MBO1419848.1 Sec-independent protein translocase subunit TatA [Streptomyces sp. FH025]
MRFSMTAIVVVVVFAIVLFGAKRLPDLARSLGKSMRILKSEAGAMRSDGSPDAGAPPVPPEVAGAEQPPARAVQAAPGATSTARPVAEPTAGSTAESTAEPTAGQAAPGERPH